MDTRDAIAKALSVGVSILDAAVMRSHALNKFADNSRLLALFDKAQRGGEITVAAIGGSITEGAWARTNGADGGNNAQAYTEILDGERCYAERVADWLREAFPKAEFNMINSGIGATPSFLGAFRLERMVLDFQPDLVFVEFSVNDPAAPYLIDTEIFDAYEAVIRRSLESGAAVCQIFTVDENNRSWQCYHKRIGDYYHIPMISYKDAIFPDACICEWRKISPDGIHPNNAGHALIAYLVTEYFKKVMDGSGTNSSFAVPNKWLYDSTFEQADIIFAADQEMWKISGAFKYMGKIPDVSYKWRGAMISDGKGYAEFKIPAGTRRVFVLYFNSSGGFTARLGDGSSQYCNTKTTQYGRALWQRIYTGGALTQAAPLKIETDSDGVVIIMGVMVSY